MYDLRASQLARLADDAAAMPRGDDIRAALSALLVVELEGGREISVCINLTELQIRDLLLRRSSRHFAKAIEMDRCTTAALPATLAHPLKTTAVTTRSNVGALNRMRGSDAIGRRRLFPPSGRQGPQVISVDHEVLHNFC